MVTLNLSNPFPIYFETETYSQDEDHITNQKIDEVSNLKIRYYNYMDKKQNILRWINPVQASHKKIHIVRKIDYAPSSLEDGKKVYEGTFPLFSYDENIKENTHYFYRVFVEDQSGNLTNGKVIDIETN